MSTRLKYFYLDLLTSLSTIKDIDNKNIKLRTSNYFKFINVWDNQVENLTKEGNKDYAFATPAIFIEINLGEAAPLGFGVVSFPSCLVKFHILHVLLNDGASMERNLFVLDCRSKLLKLLRSKFQYFEDTQDFDHGNTYHYSISFRTNFIEIDGSVFDDDFIDPGIIGSLTLNSELYYTDNNGNQYGTGLINYIYQDGASAPVIITP